MLGNVQLSCFLLSYLVALGFEAFATLRGKLWARFVTIGFTVAGLIAQSAFLIIRSREANLPPLLSSTQDWLFVLAWLAIVLYLAIVALDRAIPLGLFMLPITLALIGAGMLANDDPHMLIKDQALRRWGMIHASCLVIGTGGVLLGFALSLMYLMQHRRLRQKVAVKSQLSLPNLEKLARLNWWSVVIAVPLLTIGLVAGVILGQLTRKTTAAFSFVDPQVLAHSVVWVAMAALFFRVLRRRDVSGKVVAWQTVWAFGFLIATIVGLQLLTGDGRLDSFHSGRSVERRELLVSTGGPDLTGATLSPLTPAAEFAGLGRPSLGERGHRAHEEGTA